LGFPHNSKVEFLTDTHDWTGDRVIDTGSAGPVLMLTGDSFSNPWLPLLEASFSRIVVSHHQNGFFRPDLIQRFHPDAVLLEVIESGFRHAMPPRVPAVPPDPLAKAS
jgi:alginate O-acetyltransferase complex protein AlgJ